MLLKWLSKGEKKVYANQNLGFMTNGILSTNGGSEYFPVKICDAIWKFAASV